MGCESKRKSNACEARVLYVLARAGLDVLVPWGDNARYDLVVDIGRRFLRIQCKTGRVTNNGCVRFRTYMIGRDRSRVTYYTAEEIDYFGVWCLDTDAVYLVPYADIRKRSQPHVRVDVPRPGSTGGRQSTKVRWAGRYEASGVIEGWQRTGGEFDPRWSAP